MGCEKMGLRTKDGWTDDGRPRDYSSFAVHQQKAELKKKSLSERLETSKLYHSAYVRPSTECFGNYLNFLKHKV